MSSLWWKNEDFDTVWELSELSLPLFLSLTHTHTHDDGNNYDRCDDIRLISQLADKSKMPRLQG